MAVINVTEANFEEEVLKSDKPVLVDFWAAWCGPCKMLSPMVDQVAEETDAVKVCKINVDEEGDLAADYGVMSIPTLVLFKNGEEAARSVGVIPKPKILEFIAQYQSDPRAAVQTAALFFLRRTPGRV